MAKWQFHFTKPSSRISGIVFQGARRNGRGPWEKGSKLPLHVIQYLLLTEERKGKWVYGDVASLDEFKAQAADHKPPITWHRCPDGIKGTVEIPDQPDCFEERNIVLDNRSRRRLERIIEKVHDEYDNTCASFYEVYSFGWDEWDEDDEGRIGIREISLAGRMSLFVKIEGCVNFAVKGSSRRMEAEFRFISKKRGNWGLDATLDGPQIYFYERLRVPMTLKHGRLNVSATVQEIIKIAMTVCREFEDDMALVSEEFDAYRKKLDSQKRPNSRK